MIVATMLYAFAVALLLTLAGQTAERVAAARRWPRRPIWAAVLLASIVVPGAALLSNGKYHLPQIGLSSAARNGNPGGVIVRTEMSAAPQKSPVAWPIRSDLDAVLIGLWAAASLTLLAFLGVASIRLRRAMRRWPTLRVLNLQVFISQNVGPAVFGSVHPRIILPQTLMDAPFAVRSMVLKHEKAHVAAGDPLLLSLALVAVALMPWNALLWWQLRRLRFVIEVDCDARLLRDGVEPLAYAETLLSVGRSPSLTPFVAIALMDPVCQLEQRIKIMLLEKPGSPIIVGVLVGLTAACIAGAAQLQPPADTKGPSTEIRSARFVPPPKSAVMVNVAIYRNGILASKPAVAMNFGRPGTIEIPGLRLQIAAIDATADQVDLLVRMGSLTQPDTWPPTGPALRVAYGKEGVVQVKDASNADVRIVMVVRRVNVGEELR